MSKIVVRNLLSSSFCIVLSVHLFSTNILYAERSRKRKKQENV